MPTEVCYMYIFEVKPQFCSQYISGLDINFVRLSCTSENWRRTNRSCTTIVWRDKWKKM